MAKIQVSVSDFSGALAQNEQDLIQVSVRHPDYDQPITLDALGEDIRDVALNATEMVVLTIDSMSVPLTVDEFNDLFTGEDNAEEVLERVYKDQHPRQRRKSRRRGPQEPRVNYATLEHAGEPHRGRITEEEKQIVREHLDDINDRLAREGHRIIDPQDPELAGRYGLEVLPPPEE